MAGLRSLAYIPISNPPPHTPLPVEKSRDFRKKQIFRKIWRKFVYFVIATLLHIYRIFVIHCKIKIFGIVAI